MSVARGDVGESAIRTAIAMAGRDESSLDSLLARVVTRDSCYRLIMIVADEEPSKRHQLATLMLNYVVGFVPSDTTLRNILAFAQRSASVPGASQTMLDLEAVAKSLLAQQSVKVSRKANLHKSNFFHREAAGAAARSPHYTSMPIFQPVMTGTYGVKRTVPMSNNSAADSEFVAREKNATIKVQRPLYQLVTCKDYIDQTPLPVTSVLMAEQLKVLHSYYDNYRAHPHVLRATSVIIKMLFDAWVSKLPIGTTFAFLREATIAFLPVFLKMLVGEYTCVQKHAFDVVINVATHVQLLDSMGAIEGSAAALEAEVCWINNQLLNRLELMGNTVGDHLWLAALKSTLFVTPRDSLRDVRSTILARFMKINSYQMSHPHVFEICAEAIASRVVGPGKNDAELSRLSAEGDLYALYNAAQTFRSRKALFSVIHYAAAAELQTKKYKTDTLKHVEKALQLMIALGLPWDLQQLTYYLPQAASREVAQHVAMDIDTGTDRDNRDIKQTVSQMLSQILHGMKLEQALPGEYQTPIQSYAIGSPDPTAREGFVQDCLSTIPAMLRDDDESVRAAGVSLAFHFLRFFKPDAEQSSYGGRLIELITSDENERVRMGAAKVLGCMSALCRTQSSMLSTFALMLKSVLSRETSIPNLMRIHYILLQAVSVQQSPISNGGDINAIALQGQSFIVLQSAAESIGSSLFFKLYWAMANDTRSAVCRARLTLVNILASLELSGPATSQIHIWNKVMGDPSPPVAIIGAQRVMRISGISQYEIYEAVVNEAAQQGNTKNRHLYVMAQNIWKKIEADLKSSSLAQ